MEKAIATGDVAKLQKLVSDGNLYPYRCTITFPNKFSECLLFAKLLMDAQCKGEDDSCLLFTLSIHSVYDEDSPFRDIALKCLEGNDPGFVITYDEIGYIFFAFTTINNELVEINRQRISESDLYDIYDNIVFNNITIG